MAESLHASVTMWIEGLKQGDDEAASQLWSRYFEQLVRLARQKLGHTSRRVADEEDIALSVFRNLCDGAEAGRFDRLTDRDDLWALLITVTKHKAVDLIRYNTREKRLDGEIRGESVFLNRGDDGEAFGIDHITGAEPTPEFLVTLQSQHERLLSLLRDDSLRNVALWRMEGFSNEDIAQKLDISVRSVERKLRLIRESWSAELNE